MPSVIKYTLFLLADVAIIWLIVHFTLSMLRGGEAFQRFMAGNGGSFNKYSFYTLAVLLSFGFALYGALLFLFSWMPHWWLYGEGWMAQLLAGLGAFWGAFALPYFLKETQAKFLELRRSKLRAKAFETRLPEFAGCFGKYPEQDAFARLKREIDEAEKSHTMYQEDIEVCRYLLAVFRKSHVARSDAAPQTDNSGMAIAKIFGRSTDSAQTGP